MPNVIPRIPALPVEPAKTYPQPGGTERHHVGAPPPTKTALSSADVSYVNSLMGVTPAQRMEEILLKTGVPIPANLGPNVDVTA